MRITGLALGLVLLAAGSAQAQLAVTDRSIVRKGKLQLDIHYPRTGRADFDRLFAGLARDYARDPDLVDVSQGANSGSLSYKIRRNDAQMFSVEVSTYSYYAGHAHGMPDMNTYNFLMPEGTQIGLSDLVEGRKGMERVRDLVTAELERKLPGISVDLQARETWFLNFVPEPTVLEISFPPYVVAGYAQGTQVVRIPLASLAGVMRPDPRAPAPSFACAAAHAPVEKTVCSDAVLARLDRQVANHYADRLAQIPKERLNERPSETQYRQALSAKHGLQLANQRAWIAARDKACAGGDKDCLMRAYKSRQAALYQPPF